MKIALDCRMIGRSGIGTVLRELIPLWLRSSHRLMLLGDPADLNRYLSLGAEIRPFTEPIYSVREQLRYPWRALRDADVLLFPHYNVPILCPIPVVSVIHDLAPLALPRFFAGPAKRLYAHLFSRLAARNSAAVIAVSRFTRLEIVERLGIHPGRIRVIYNGPGRSYPEGSAAAGDSGSHLPAGTLSPYVLAVGNLKPHKNLGRLVQSLALLRLRGHGLLSLVIAGRPFADLRGTADLLGVSVEDLPKMGVVRTGFVPDEHMAALYANASLVVLPSLYEGFGLTALEALRFGTLPLVADSASLPEVIDDPELRFDPFSVEAMAERMALYLDRPELRAAKVAAQRSATQRFSWSKAARSYIEVMEEVCREKPGGGHKAGRKS